MSKKLSNMFNVERNDNEIYDEDNFDENLKKNEVKDEEIHKTMSLKNANASTLDNSIKSPKHKSKLIDEKTKQSKSKTSEDKKCKNLEKEERKFKLEQNKNVKSSEFKNISTFRKAFFNRVLKMNNKSEEKRRLPEDETYDDDNANNNTTCDDKTMTKEKNISYITKDYKNTTHISNISKIDNEEIYDEDEQELNDIKVKQDIEETEICKTKISVSIKDDKKDVKPQLVKYSDSDESFDEDTNEVIRNKKHLRSELLDFTKKLRNYLITKKNNSKSNIKEKLLTIDLAEKNVFQNTELRCQSSCNDIYDEDNETERLKTKDIENNEIYDEDELEASISKKSTSIHQSQIPCKINNLSSFDNENQKNIVSAHEKKQNDITTSVEQETNSESKELKSPLNKKEQMLEISKKKTIATFKVIINRIQKKLKENNYNDVYDCDDINEEKVEAKHINVVEEVYDSDDKEFERKYEIISSLNLKLINDQKQNKSSKKENKIVEKRSIAINKKNEKKTINIEIYDEDDDDVKDSNIFEEIYENDDEDENISLKIPNPTTDFTNKLNINQTIQRCAENNIPQKHKTEVNSSYTINKDMKDKEFEKNDDDQKMNSKLKSDSVNLKKTSDKKNKITEKEKKVKKKIKEEIKSTSKFYVNEKSQNTKSKGTIENNEYEKESDEIIDNFYEQMICDQIESAENEQELKDAIESIKSIFESTKLTSPYAKEMSDIKFFSVKDRIKFYENVSNN